METYPDDPPTIEVTSYEGIDDSDVLKLQEFLDQEVINSSIIFMPKTVHVPLNLSAHKRKYFYFSYNKYRLVYLRAHFLAKVSRLLFKIIITTTCMCNSLYLHCTVWPIYFPVTCHFSFSVIQQA